METDHLSLALQCVTALAVAFSTFYSYRAKKIGEHNTERIEQVHDCLNEARDIAEGRAVAPPNFHALESTLPTGEKP